MVKNKINLRTQTRIGAVFVFVVLLIAAYFVSVKISGSGSVSPNAPESQPKAFMPCVNIRCADGYTCNKATNKCVKSTTVNFKGDQECKKDSDCGDEKKVCKNGYCKTKPNPTDDFPNACNETNCPTGYYCDDETVKCVPEPTPTPTTITVEVSRTTTPTSTPTKSVGEGSVKCPYNMKSNGKCESGKLPLTVANCCVSTFYHY